MFRRKSSTPAIDVSKLSSLIAEGVAIAGDITLDHGLRLDGRVDGSVRGRTESGGLLVISEKGSVHGNVRVHDAVINGTIVGDLEVGHYLELQAGARVTGTIRYSQLRMECGATVDGRLERIGTRAEPRIATTENVVTLTRIGLVAGAQGGD